MKNIDSFFKSYR